MHRSPWLIVLCFCLSGVAAAADPEAIQGTWKVVAAERNGKQVPAEKTEKVKLTFKGNEVIVLDDGREEKATIKLDPTTKPKSFDLTLAKGKEETVLGIYALEGDMLKLAWIKGGGQRPKEFGGEDVMYFLLKREK